MFHSCRYKALLFVPDTFITRRRRQAVSDCHAASQPAGVSDARSGSASLQTPVSQRRRRAQDTFDLGGGGEVEGAPPLSTSPSAPASRSHL